MNRIAVAALVVTLACAGSRAERTAPPEQGVRPVAGAPDAADTRRSAAAPHAAAPHSHTAQMSRICPMDVPGTTISASDTPEGEALTFTTTSGQVDELRRRVRALAEMHNQHVSTVAPSPGPGETQGTGSAVTAPEAAPQGHHMMPPPSRATVEDVDNGARVAIAPLDPAQADQLRSATRMHAMHMQQHGCGMVHGGATQR